MLRQAKKSFTIECIDDPDSITTLSSTPDHMQPQLLCRTLEKRDTVMTDHLFRLHVAHKAIIVQLGVLHFRGITKRLKERGLSDKDMICCFSYSILSHEINAALKSGQVSGCTTVKAETSAEIDFLAKKILQEVKSKKISALAIAENTQSRFLSDFFKVNFQASIKPEYYVDAVLKMDQMNEEIQYKLNHVGIKTHRAHNYWVISNINTKDVGDRIYLLK